MAERLGYPGLDDLQGGSFILYCFGGKGTIDINISKVLVVIPLST